MGLRGSTERMTKLESIPNSPDDEAIIRVRTYAGGQYSIEALLVPAGFPAKIMTSGNKMDDYLEDVYDCAPGTYIVTTREAARRWNAGLAAVKERSIVEEKEMLSLRLYIMRGGDAAAWTMDAQEA